MSSFDTEIPQLNVEDVLNYAQAEGRVHPVEWDRLYRMLPRREENDVPVPLILGGSDAPAFLKCMRLAIHIQYASEQKVLNRVAVFLLGRRPHQWIYVGGARPPERRQPPPRPSRPQGLPRPQREPETFFNL